MWIQGSKGRQFARGCNRPGTFNEPKYVVRTTTLWQAVVSNDAYSCVRMA